MKKFGGDKGRLEITLGQPEYGRGMGGCSETTTPSMPRRPEAPPASRCIVENESGVGGPRLWQTEPEREVSAQGSGGWSGSEMQAARRAPSVGRQLLRLGGGRCVYASRDAGSGPGDWARTDPPLPAARGPVLSWGRPGPGPALPDDPMRVGPLR